MSSKLKILSFVDPQSWDSVEREWSLQLAGSLPQVRGREWPAVHSIHRAQQTPSLIVFRISPQVLMLRRIWSLMDFSPVVHLSRVGARVQETVFERDPSVWSASCLSLGKPKPGARVRMGQAELRVRLTSYCLAVNNSSSCHIKYFLCRGQCVPGTLYLHFLTESLTTATALWSSILQVEEIQVLVDGKQPVAVLELLTMLVGSSIRGLRTLVPASGEANSKGILPERGQWLGRPSWALSPGHRPCVLFPVASCKSCCSGIAVAPLLSSGPIHWWDFPTWSDVGGLSRLA